MAKRGLLQDKRGDIGLPDLIFIILNLVFFAILFAFIWRASTNAIVYEQAYSKEIALALDEAKPGMLIYIYLPKMADFIISQKLKPENVIRVNNADRSVIVDFSGKGGASFKFFSEGDVKAEVKGEYVYLTVGKKT